MLAACQLVCPALRGFIRRSFPYTCFGVNMDFLEVPGYIAGVTNPMFEQHEEWWDILCDIPTGRVVVRFFVFLEAMKGEVWLAAINFVLGSVGLSPNQRDLECGGGETRRC